jgi:hypothetical protein
MLTISLLEPKKYEIISPTKENDVVKATSVQRTKKTLIGLNFETNTKAKNTGRWTRRGYRLMKCVYPKLSKTKPSQISTTVA